MNVKFILQKTNQLLVQQSMVILFVLLFVLFAITVGDTFISSINLQNVARQISFDLPVALSMTTVLIAGKQKGQSVKATEESPSPASNVIDIFDALRKSIKAEAKPR